MRIIVVVKHVPDSRAAVRPKVDGSGIESEGVKHVCDPFDEIALEQASRLKSQRKDIEEIVVLSVGGNGAAETLRHGLAMGADRAVHVLEESIGHHQELSAAKLCAAAIGRIAPSAVLVLCGARATDTGSGEFGPALAEFLGLAHAGAVTKLEVSADGTGLRANCRVEGAELVLEIALPALVTCERGLVEPQQPSLPKLMKARKQPVETIRGAELGGAADLDPRLVNLASLPSRPTCRMLEGDVGAMARELARVLREEAKVI